MPESEVERVRNATEDPADARMRRALQSPPGTDRVLAEIGQMRRELAELRAEQQELAKAVHELAKTFRALALHFGIASEPYSKPKGVEKPRDAPGFA
ncbi:MAG TPA: hypothetical protein VN864_07705 [Thermoplasmata archaeon]|nr:hypothetical protein [Thermoplasmata archaeon]